MGKQRDANTDSVSTLTQQQDPFSTQAQDTSSPTYQQDLVTAPLQSVARHQFKGKGQRSKPLNRTLIGMAIALMAVGTGVWVLNITDTIKGPWSGVFGAVFTFVGAVVALVQPNPQSVAEPTASATTTPLPPNTQPLAPLNEDPRMPRTNGQEGLLRVYATKSLRGFTVDLCNGYDGTTTAAAQNIVEREISGETCYVAIFQSLPPGGYTVHIYRRELMARITIYPGQVSEIDWR
jgi:hypothetical protein